MARRLPELCSEARHEDLLLHYVQGAQQTLLNVDQLGNFLMGFGVLALGYLLNADLSRVTASLSPQPLLAWATLGAWGLAVALLTAFVRTYIFRVIAGRSVHAVDGDPKQIGELLELPEELNYELFTQRQRSFEDFLRNNYQACDRLTPESLLYARWSYMRFMTVKKLAEMERMRRLLGGALSAGVAFKVSLVALLA